jgi:protein-S-isoprenylcysteine O-methyltransferase Ste14
MNSLSVRVPVSQLAEVPRTTRAKTSSVELRRLSHVTGRIVVFAAISAALLLGWGLDQILVLFSHPARAVVLGGIALMFALSLARALTAPLPASRPRLKVRHTVSLLLLSAASIPVLSSAYFDGRVLLYLPGADLTRYSGMALFVAGAILSTRAQQFLDRRSISGLSIESNRQSASKGPFARLCHARPAGLILMSIGLPLAFLSKVGLAGGAVCAVLLAVWACREEPLPPGESSPR